MNTFVRQTAGLSVAVAGRESAACQETFDELAR
jgi:hypothetical protein